MSQHAFQGLSHDLLDKKQGRLKDNFPESFGLRVHRAISWIGRAERETDDDDARFIFLWIGFNAAYADEDDFQSPSYKERKAFGGFFRKIEALDANRRVYDAVWSHFSGPIRMLLQNKYVFAPFWDHQNGISGCEDWERKLAYAKRDCNRALEEQRAARVLRLLFDRLYVLRNQIMHGGATWDSSVNRDQVRDSTRILEFLVPEFIDIMMDNPEEHWGRPFYPVRD